MGECPGQSAPTRRNLSTTSKNKSQHFSALGKSSRWKLQSSPKSHIQRVWNQGAVRSSCSWDVFHICHIPELWQHESLAAVTCRRCTKDAWTQNSFKATVSTILIPSIYPMESCNTITTLLMQWPLTQVPTTWSMLKAFSGALHMGKPDSKHVTALHEHSHLTLHGIGTPSHCFTKHHTHPWD